MEPTVGPVSYPGNARTMEVSRTPPGGRGSSSRATRTRGSGRYPRRDMALSRIPPRARDAAVALLAFALTLLMLGLGGTSSSANGLDALGVVLAAATSLPLVARRRDSLLVFAVTALASAALNAAGYAEGPPFGPTIALFFVASDARTRVHLVRTATVVAGLFALHVASTLVSHGGFPTSPVLFG